jgi:hypothetical protein
MNHKDLIKQYVDSGLKLPKYQVMQLSGSDKKTYLRKRLIANKQSSNVFELSPYEIDLMDSVDMDKYYDELFTKKINFYNLSGNRDLDEFLRELRDEFKSKYLDMVINKGVSLPRNQFFELPFTDKLRYLKWNASLSLDKKSIVDIFKDLIDELKIYYIKNLIKYHGKNILNHDSIRWKVSNYRDEIYLDFLNIIKKHNLIKDES